jgi:hypothetical protein
VARKTWDTVGSTQTYLSGRQPVSVDVDGHRVLGRSRIAGRIQLPQPAGIVGRDSVDKRDDMHVWFVIAKMCVPVVEVHHQRVFFLRIVHINFRELILLQAMDRHAGCGKVSEAEITFVVNKDILAVGVGSYMIPIERAPLDVRHRRNLAGYVWCSFVLPCTNQNQGLFVDYELTGSNPPWTKERRLAA